MAREGLRLVVNEALERGAEEGRVEAAERARRPRVRRTALSAADAPAVEHTNASAREEAIRRALSEMNGFGFGEEDDDVHVA